MQKIVTGMVNSVFTFKDALSMTGSVLIIVLGAAFIFLGVYLALSKISNKTLSVIVVTIMTILGMIPAVTAFHALVDKQATVNLAKEYQAELKARKTELELLEQKQVNAKQQLLNVRQAAEIESLESEARLLKNAQLQINNYREIAEMNLLETNLQQTSVHRKIVRPLSTEIVKKTEGMLWWKKEVEKESSVSTYDEALVILTHDIVAKFGFDIQDIRLINSKEIPDTIIVSGIKPKFTGKTKDSHTKELVEVRKTSFGTNDLKKTFGYADIPIEKLKENILDLEHGISIDNNQYPKASAYADECINEFNARLQKGLQTQFMDEPVKKLAEKFLKLILAPLGKNIIFADQTNGDALSLDDYLKTQIENIEIEKESIKSKPELEAIKEIDAEVKQEVKEVAAE